MTGSCQKSEALMNAALWKVETKGSKYENVSGLVVRLWGCRVDESWAGPSRWTGAKLMRFRKTPSDACRRDLRGERDNPFQQNFFQNPCVFEKCKHQHFSLTRDIESNKGTAKVFCLS